MITVQQLLNEKGHEIWSIHPDKSIRDAMKVMMDRDIGSLLVVTNARLLGTLRSDNARVSVLSDGETSVSTKVWEIIEPAVPSVGPTDTIEQCMTLMTERRLRYLPVLRQGNPVGILSIGDLVKWIIYEQRATIAKLEHYICGRVAN